MHIGFDITSLYIAKAGVFEYRRHLLQALLQHDDENAYLLLDYVPFHSDHPEPSEVLTLKAPNARIVRCKGLKHRRLARWDALQRPLPRSLAAMVDGSLLWPWAATANASRRRNLHKALQDVNVFHSSDVLPWAQPQAFNIITIHDLTPLLFPKYHTANTREMQAQVRRFAQEKADAVITGSNATKKDLVDHVGIPSERVHVVNYGVSQAFHPIEKHETLVQALAPLGLSPNGYILHVGTIEPRKNLVRLVEAYSQMQKMVPHPVPKLVLAGARGWQFQDVFKRVQALALAENVVFLGRVPENLLPALYNGAVAFAYPSLYEGFGLPPLEAMACGVPVIASDTSSLPEVVGDAGVLVDPNDTGALADTLATLLNDAEKRAELSARGPARASLFSWERTAKETLKIYQSGMSTKNQQNQR